MSFVSGLLSSVSSLAGALVNPVLEGLGIGGSVGELFNDMSGRSQFEYTKEENDRNRAYNSEEAEKARQFESQEAQVARDFSSREAQVARDFNSAEAQKARDWDAPLAQLGRMQQAGLNPMLINGLNNNGAIASASPAGTAQAMGAQASTGGSLAPNAITNPFKDLSETALNLANVQKTSAEADRTRKLLPGEIAIQGMSLKTGKEGLKLSKKNRQKIEAEMGVLKAQVDKMQKDMQEVDSRIELNKLDAEQRKIFLNEFEERLQAELRKTISETNLNDARIKEVASVITRNYAAAAFDKERAKTETIRAGIASYDFLFRNVTFDNDVHKSFMDFNLAEDNYSITLEENNKRKAYNKWLKGDDGYGAFSNSIMLFKDCSGAVTSTINAIPQFKVLKYIK